MQTKEQEIAQRVLMLLKLDSKNLFHRLSDRKREYMEVFSQKRTRSHFEEIFHTRYPEAGLKELMHCSLDTIAALDQFYTEVEEMFWYVMHTEDMPITVEDNASRYVKRLENYYQTLHLYLDAELGINQDEETPTEIIATETTQTESRSVEHLFFDDTNTENNKSPDEQN
ncbi:MAG: hypothetical protein ACOYL6_09520 [Bacteriovoracaceae bacterium]